MEPLIRKRRRRLPSDSNGTTAASAGNIQLDQSRRRREDQEWSPSPIVVDEATTMPASSSWNKITLQPATNKVESVIMTPTKDEDESLCPSLNPTKLASKAACRSSSCFEGYEFRAGGNRRSDDICYNKSNIINNNSINNNYSGNRRKLELKQQQLAKEHVQSHSAPKLDRPETMTTTTTTDGGCLLSVVSVVTMTTGQLRGLTTKTTTITKRGGLLASCWWLTILILIAYELYLQARTNNHHSLSTCQRCLPDVAFIRTCSAAEILLLDAEPPLGPEAATTAAAHQRTRRDATIDAGMSSTTFKTNSSTIITTTTTSGEQQQQPTKADNTSTTINDNNNNTINSTMRSATSMTTNSNAINKHHNYHQYNVLCNSRCNCVILEPATTSLSGTTRNSSSSSSSSQQTSASTNNQLLEGSSSQRQPPSGSSNVHDETITTQEERQTTNSIHQPAVVNVNESTRSQQQQQMRPPAQEKLAAAVGLEQALIAFNEDYSVDYEQSQQPASGSSGNGLDDAGAADVDSASMVALNVPGASGNDRAPSRPPADQSNAASAFWLPATAGGEGGSSMRVNVTASFNLETKATNKYNNNNNNNNNGSSTVQPPPPDGRRQVTGGSLLQVQNQSITDEINGLSNSNSKSDAVGGSSRQRQLQISGQQQEPSNGSLLTQKQEANNKQSQQQLSGLGGPQPLALFPLHHRHQQQQQQQQSHNGGGGAHHYQPLGPGSGRGSSGPQLYAQSLYSSQAPKLSYHAHTPYLKSSGGSGQQSQASSFGDSMSMGQPMGAPPGGGHQYHHMRANYLAHHQRQMSMGSGGGRRPISGIIPVGSIQRLVPLRTLNASKKLDWNTTTTTTTSQSNSTTNLNWAESPEFAQKLKLMLEELETNDVQSLILRDNNIQFELWSEIYALLALTMRQQLFHLDMSHNSLAKLGITFTGYIEHHLAAHGSWPFNGPQASHGGSISQSGGGGGGGSMMNEISTLKQLKTSNKQLPAAGGRMKHSLLSGGKLYTLVKRLQLEAANGSSVGGFNNTLLANTANNTTLLQQPMSLRALDLSHNKLKWLINDQFRALKHVQTIRLDYNRIRYINQHAFSGLESLRFLNLNFNRLQVIYIEQFQTNYNLLALTLRSNFLAYLRGGSFASLANLRRLDLSRNKLTIMSNNAFVGLESLELLNCSSNQFVHAPSASLHSLTSLRQLDLSDNLVAQLAPGTFFHLPIEELWLNQNEQLVAIDRGAFWDLPYLRSLHLKWNPMLMSINSQAFVGTQSLQVIDVEGCQALEMGTREMLDNITMAATSRLLRYEQSRLNQSGLMAEEMLAPSGGGAAGSGHTINSSLSDAVANSRLTTTTNTKHSVSSSQTSHHHFTRRSDQLEGAGPNSLKYAYCLLIVGLLLLALYFVFNFTSTSHYMEARRRRRRIYATTTTKMHGQDSTDLDGESVSMSMSSGGGSGSSSSESVEAYPMCAQPDNLVIATVAGRAAAAANSPSRQYQTPDDVGGGNEGQQEEASISLSGENNDISVISDSAYCLSWPHPPNQADGNDNSDLCCSEESDQQHQVVTGDIQRQQQTQSSPTIDLIHSQLIAAGFDYGHANCAHFYQSLGPALQLADMTANFVNNIDYY